MKFPQERIHILSAFGDIMGSGIYRRRLTEEKKDNLSFWYKFDRIVDQFEVNHEYFIKHLGDGFLCILKTNGKNGFQTMRFLKELALLKKRIDALIKKSEPRPAGFRVHVAAGDAIQTILTDGEMVFHGYHLDLIGTTIKTDGLKSTSFVVHESAKQLMTSREIAVAGFQFDLLKPPQCKRSKESLYNNEFKKLYALSQ